MAGEAQEDQPILQKRILDHISATLFSKGDQGGLKISKRSKFEMGTKSSLTGCEGLDDRELDKRIMSSMLTYHNLGMKLRDKGAMLLETIERLKAEKAYRNELAAEECPKPAPSTSLSTIGASDVSTEATSSIPQAGKRVEGAQKFQAKDENASTENERHSPHTSSLNYNCSPDLTSVGTHWVDDIYISRQMGVLSSSFVDNSSQSLSRSFSKKDLASLSNGSSSQNETTHVLVDKVEPAVVLADEDEPKVMELSQNEDDLSEFIVFSECMKKAKICYPSAKHPEAIDICYPDIACLAPATYMSSTIMNFYIEFLQQQASSTNKSCNYHFFNTYFYKRLCEVVSYKGCDRKSVFTKFRRWWKGVKIFEKVYLLIPIHEDFHWSLVIICMPDREDVAGPMLLHLDSLGFHDSRVIINNIRSCLIEEWNYLKQEVALSEHPFADSVWENLPCIIKGVITPVPQQTNGYDCGLFVLYFMERFIQEAPERLKEKDLTMFGTLWFKPEEASGLRRKIRTLLKDELEKANEGMDV